MNSEKHSEYELQVLLNSNYFNSEYIYYSAFQNSILKKLFKKCSKTGSNFGIPDRIYFDESAQTLIIFECKKDNLIKAIKDCYYYINNLTNYDYIESLYS